VFSHPLLWEFRFLLEISLRENQVKSLYVDSYLRWKGVKLKYSTFFQVEGSYVYARMVWNVTV